MHHQVAGLQLQARGDGQAVWRRLQPPSTRLGRARGQGTGPCWLKTEQCPWSGPLESEMSLCLNDVGWIFFFRRAVLLFPDLCRLLASAACSEEQAQTTTRSSTALCHGTGWQALPFACFMRCSLLPGSGDTSNSPVQPLLQGGCRPAPRPGSTHLSFPGHRALLCSAQEMPIGSCPMHPAPLAEGAPAWLHTLRCGCQADSCRDFYHGKGSFLPDSLPDNSNFQ